MTPPYIVVWSGSKERRGECLPLTPLFVTASSLVGATSTAGATREISPRDMPVEPALKSEERRGCMTDAEFRVALTGKEARNERTVRTFAPKGVPTPYEQKKAARRGQILPDYFTTPS